MTLFTTWCESARASGASGASGGPGSPPGLNLQRRNRKHRVHLPTAVGVFQPELPVMCCQPSTPLTVCEEVTSPAASLTPAAKPRRRSCSQHPKLPVGFETVWPNIHFLKDVNVPSTEFSKTASSLLLAVVSMSSLLPSDCWSDVAQCAALIRVAGNSPGRF